MGFVERREKLYDWMTEEGIALLVFEDSESNRDKAVRYLSGQPGDALLFLSIERKCLLVPWDTIMASLYAKVDAVLPYNGFDMNPCTAARSAAEYFKVPSGNKIEIPSDTPYPNFLNFVETLSDYDVICRNDGAKSEVEKLRSIKDEDEIKLYRLCAEKTNEIISLIEKNICNGTLKTESDVALFIEAECRKKGCEGTGFTTLAAGAQRSFGIHCFPSYTSGAFADKGLSILDFGIVLEGYTSDVTLTFANKLTKAQEKQISLVEQAFYLAYNKVAVDYKNGDILARDIALEVDSFFEKEKLFMPHGLGHGIGLDAHEAPYLRRQKTNNWVLKQNMIFTIEPGLYDKDLGGCRFENDILLSKDGAEIITKSKIVRL